MRISTTQMSLTHFPLLPPPPPSRPALIFFSDLNFWILTRSLSRFDLHFGLSRHLSGPHCLCISVSLSL